MDGGLVEFRTGHHQNSRKQQWNGKNDDNHTNTHHKLLPRPDRSVRKSPRSAFYRLQWTAIFLPSDQIRQLGLHSRLLVNLYPEGNGTRTFQIVFLPCSSSRLLGSQAPIDSVGLSSTHCHRDESRASVKNAGEGRRKQRPSSLTLGLRHPKSSRASRWSVPGCKHIIASFGTFVNSSSSELSPSICIGPSTQPVAWGSPGESDISIQLQSVGILICWGSWWIE